MVWLFYHMLTKKSTKETVLIIRLTNWKQRRLRLTQLIVTRLIFLTFAARRHKALAVMPNYNNARHLIVLICVYILFVSILGWQTRFLSWKPQPIATVVRVTITCLFAPAILEELFFRVLLLPYPFETSFKSYLLRSALSLFLFIVYHPLNASTFFPQGRKVFFDRIFLVLAASLGIVCTITYWQTGSIWLPVLIHWITVAVWLSCLGGSDKLNYVGNK